MKKQIGFLLFFLTLASATLCYGAEAQPTMNQIISDSVIFEFDTPIAYVRGTRQTMDVDLLLQDDRTLVPIKFVAEWFGGTADWDQPTQTAFITVLDKQLRLKAGEPVIYVNGTPVPTDVAPVFTGGRNFAPIRAVADILGVFTYYQPVTQGYSPVILSPYSLTEQTAIALTNHIIENYTFRSAMTLQDFSLQAMPSENSHFSISGTLASDYPMKTLTVKILDQSGGTEAAFSLLLNALSVDLANLDFTAFQPALASGPKTLELWASDTVWTRRLARQALADQTGRLRFTWPVPGRNLITTVFDCADPSCHSNGTLCTYCGRHHNRHGAIDIAAPDGTPVTASAPGRVSAAGDNAGGSGYGTVVIIDHGNGYSTQYSHLSEIYVKVGDLVGQEQKIAAVGDRHLDFTLWHQQDKLDPLPLLQLPEDVRCESACDQKVLDAVLSPQNIS